MSDLLLIFFRSAIIFIKYVFYIHNLIHLLIHLLSYLNPFCNPHFLHTADVDSVSKLRDLHWLSNTFRDWDPKSWQTKVLAKIGNGKGSELKVWKFVDEETMRMVLDHLLVRFLKFINKPSVTYFKKNFIDFWKEEIGWIRCINFNILSSLVKFRDIDPNILMI